MKEIYKYLASLLVFLIVFLSKTVDASAIGVEATFSGWTFERQQFVEPGKHHASDKFNVYSMNGEVAYCLEPTVHYGTDGYYLGTWEDTGIPNNIKEKIILIGYYGYTYPGHQTLEYRAASQAMIWETVMGEGSYVRFSKNYWYKGEILDISAERAEIERLIATHSIRPSFNGGYYQVQKGESVVLTDTNNVLSEFDVVVTGADYNVDGNVLTVTPNGETVNVMLRKRMPYSTNYKLFIGEGIQKMMIPGSSDPVIASVQIDAFSGSVEGSKLDRETGNIAQGQATLKGAKYGIYEKDTGNLVTTFTTDSNGHFKSDSVLESKEYYIQEIEASEGYKLDKTRYDFSMVDKETVHIDLYEDVVKNYISILKQYDYVDGNTTILHPESNIEFEIFYPDGRKFGSITTDKNGYASTTIPYGIWRFHQVNTNVGFSKISDFYVTVDYNSKTEQYYNILNNKLTAYVQVTKKDSETKKIIAMANTTFKILNTDTNEYVSQYVAGNVYSEFKTDENGVFTTYLKLEAGNYRLIEINEPYGYLIDDEGLNFNIGENTHYYYSDYGVTIALEFENTPIKGILEIHKTGENFVVSNNSFRYDSIPLDNVKFDIYADEDIKTSDGKHLYYHKGDKVESITTDKNGYAKSKKLPLGKYYLVEINTKNDYLLDTEEYHFELSVIDNKTAIVYNSFSKLNILKKGDAELLKTDVVDSEHIEGVLVELYTEKNECIFRGKTDNDGKIRVENLKVGKYYFLERETVNGYLLNENKVWFEIKENGEVVKSKMTNERVEGIINLHKDGERFTINTACENSECFVYETNKNLAGIKFALYAREDIILNNIVRFKTGDLVATGITDEDGNLVFDNLYLGKYFIKEVETKKEYILDEKEYDIDLIYINSRTPIVEANYSLKNYLIKGNSEFIKTDFIDDEPIAGVLIELYTENNELVFSGKTDKDGKIILKNIPYGKYYFIEKDTVTGYVLNEEPLSFEIKENGEIVKSKMTNERVEGIINIHKDGEKYTINNLCEDSNCFVYETNENLLGIKFELYAREDIILNNIVRFKAGDLVATGTTDEDGNLVFDNLYLGKYFVKEVETKEEYILDNKEYDLELDYIDSKTPIIEVPYLLKNYLIKSDLEFTKVDLADGTPLPNTLVEIYNENNELIFSGKTDESGKIVLKNIPYGNYYILEKESPEGYVLNEEPILFEVKSNGEVVKATMENKKIVKVPDTLKNDYLIITMLGISAIGLGTVIYGITKNKKTKKK